MNPLSVLCVVACMAAAVLASPTHGNAISRNLKPSQWLKRSELEDIPSLDQVTFEQLESMPLEEGAELLRKYYHLSHIDYSVAPTFVPSPSNIPVYIIKSNGEKETATLNNYVQVAKDMPNFGDQEVTIIITGLPKTLESVKNANKKLIQAYVQYFSQKPQPPTNIEGVNMANWESLKPVGGYVVVIDLGSTITDFERYATFNTHQTGKMIAKSLVELTNDCDVPFDVIHVIGQGLGANTAGVAGKAFQKMTGHKLRHITALDPARQLAKDPKVLSGLTRGAADFVDAIHTSALGMGTTKRVGDVDFFPNGPSDGVPGARNVIEAAVRAILYYAESVRPGNKRNFPAVQASCMKQYKNNNGYGKRAYMGHGTAKDLTGDYFLEVKSESPYGMRTPATKQNTYHGVHQISSLQTSDY